MTERISRLYCVRFLWVLLFLISTQGIAQNKTTKKEKKKTDKINLIDQSTIPLFHGIFIGYDLSGPLYRAFSDDYISYEVQVEVNLKNRVFPAFELGYGTADKWSDHGINYKARAPYFRVGADYNFLYKKHAKNYLTAGLRYGYSKFDYEITSPEMSDPIWNPNPTESPVMEHAKIPSSMHWMEFVVGVRTAIFKNLYMGWSLRMRYKLSTDESDIGNPWYVPGYGIFKSSRMGLSYSIIYKIPGGKKKKK